MLTQIKERVRRFSLECVSALPLVVHLRLGLHMHFFKEEGRAAAYSSLVGVSLGKPAVATQLFGSHQQVCRICVVHMSFLT